MRKRANMLTKAAFATLRADKELAVLPMISGVIVFLGVVVYALIAMNFNLYNDHAPRLATLYQWLAYALFYLVTTIVVTFFEAAIFAGATERFNGGDPTIKSSLKAARRRMKPLLVFALFMGTIGLIMRTLSEKLPLVGKIFVWIADIAWSIANIFSVPVIMSTEEDVTPVEAAKKSVGIVKKVWGENAIGQLFVGGIAFLIMFILLCIFVGSTLTSVAFGTVGVMSGILALLSLIGFWVVVAATSAMNSIIKAAAYHYAVTGDTPEHFSKELMQHAMTLKRSRKLFSGK